MRKADQRRFLVRLNLTNPRHLRAWERLQTRGDASYTEAIVDVLNQQADRAWVDNLCDELTQAVHTAVAEVAPSIAASSSKAPEPAANTTVAPISQENYAAARAFMDGLL